MLWSRNLHTGPSERQQGLTGASGMGTTRFLGWNRRFGLAHPYAIMPANRKAASKIQPEFRELRSILEASTGVHRCFLFSEKEGTQSNELPAAELCFGSTALCSNCFGAGTSSARHICHPQDILSYALPKSPCRLRPLVIDGALVVCLEVPAGPEVQLHHQLQAKHFSVNNDEKLHLNPEELMSQAGNPSLGTKFYCVSTQMAQAVSDFTRDRLRPPLT